MIDVEKRWKDINIDMGEYKDKYYKIKATDDLFQASFAYFSPARKHRHTV